MFPDHGHRWPLWESGNGKYTMDPTDYDLSPELTAGLREWYDDWEINCPPFGTWPSPAHGQRWGETGAALSRWLDRVVGPLVTVSYEATNLYC